MGRCTLPGTAQSRRRKGMRDLPEGRTSMVVGDLGQASEAKERGRGEGFSVGEAS